MGYKRQSGKVTQGVTKELGSSLGGKYMPEGVHNVKIASAGISLDENQEVTAIIFEFINSFEETIKDRVFIYSMGSAELSYKFKRLLSSIMTSQQDLADTVDMITHRELGYIANITGRSLCIVVGNTEGYNLRKTPAGIEAYEGDEVLGTFTSIMEANQKLKDRPKAMRVVTDYRRSEGGEKRHTFFDSTEESSTSEDSGGSGNMGNGGVRKVSPIPKSKQFF